MSKLVSDRSKVIIAVKQCRENLGHTPSLREFTATSGITERQATKFFPNWSSAIREAGLRPDRRLGLDDMDLLTDWGHLARKPGQIPTL